MFVWFSVSSPTVNGTIYWQYTDINNNNTVNTLWHPYNSLLLFKSHSLEHKTVPVNDIYQHYYIMIKTKSY